MECEGEFELTLSDFETDKASHILTLMKSWRTFTVIISKVLKQAIYICSYLCNCNGSNNLYK